MDFITIVLLAWLGPTALFLAATRGLPRSNRWLGAIILAVTAPLCFWFGSFAESFGSGLCYSRVMDRVADAVESGESASRVAARIRALPLRGYETSCEEVEQQANRLPRPPTAHAR